MIRQVNDMDERKRQKCAQILIMRKAIKIRHTTYHGLVKIKNVIKIYKKRGVCYKHIDIMLSKFLILF